MKEKITPEQYRDLIHEGKLEDPLIYLESIMMGQDPSGTSELYDLASEIQDLTGGAPNPEEWAEVFDLICRAAKYQKTTSAASLTAAKTLAEFVHPRLKQVDIISSQKEGEGLVGELTTMEIDLFREKFNDVF